MIISSASVAVRLRSCISCSVSVLAPMSLDSFNDVLRAANEIPVRVRIGENPHQVVGAAGLRVSAVGLLASFFAGCRCGMADAPLTGSNSARRRAVTVDP
jgi:hypothetical protein